MLHDTSPRISSLDSNRSTETRSCLACSWGKTSNGAREKQIGCLPKSKWVLWMSILNVQHAISMIIYASFACFVMTCTTKSVAQPSWGPKIPKYYLQSCWYSNDFTSNCSCLARSWPRISHDQTGLTFRNTFDPTTYSAKKGPPARFNK